MKEKLKKIRNVVLHVLFLVVLFIGSVLLFSRRINQTVPDAAEPMAQSTFPLVYMEREGVDFNCLHGYAQEMDVSFMRDCITPLESDRSIGLRIRTFSTSVESVSYEVLSLDGSQTLENTKVIQLEREDDYLYARLELQSGMLMNHEYVLCIRLVSGGRSIYYYTHVLLADGLHTDDYIRFVSGFYEKCVNKTDLDTVGAAVEPDDTTDEEQTLAYMDIHDSVSQLTWGSLNPQIYYKPVPQIKEINGNTGSLTLDYRIAATSDQGTAEVYNVHEFYRVRFTDSRVFLLNFERTTDEVFNPENEPVGEQGIRLGITGKQISFKSDEKGSQVAFVQENELWAFDTKRETLTQVFGFPQQENRDYRDFYDANSIRILKVGTDGDIWFAVAGYMNRGAHEGENGVALYRFDGVASMVEEMAFLSSMENPEQLARDTEMLCYITNDGRRFCVFLGETLWSLDLTTRQLTPLVELVHNGCCAASRSGRSFAWLGEGKIYGSSALSVLDIETGEVREISCGENERIRPLCYMGEDLVYGLARRTDISTPAGGGGIFPMFCLKIEDLEGNLKKTYQSDGCFVTGARISDNLLTLTRVRKNGDRYEEADEDQIVSMDTGSSVQMGAATANGARKQTQVYLRVGTQIGTDTPLIARSKMLLSDTAKNVTVPVQAEREKLYLVYAHGGLYDVFTYPNEAVLAADANVGTVIDSEHNYIWVRGDRAVSKEIKAADVPAAMTAGQYDIAALAAGTGKEILDMGGCTLDQMLYFISHGSPVLAMTPQGPTAIVGYDGYNVYLMDPGETEWHYGGLNDSTALFEEAGNLFLTWAPGS